MMKNKNHAINIDVFGSRILDGCKTILQLGLRLGFISMTIVSVGCNSSNNHYHSNPIAQPGSDPAKQELQTGGPGSGGGGTGDGGGGQGVYCSETVSDSNLKGKLLVRDVYEAIKNHKRIMNSSGLGPGGSIILDDTTAKHLVKILQVYFGPASRDLDFVNVEFWRKFSKNISFIADDATLHPSQDANSPLALPEGCKIVQIAYWDEASGPAEEGTLHVDKTRWKQLDQFNKIALLAHEFFFKQARKSGYKNSDFVRYKVGHLLAAEALKPMFQEWNPSKDQRLRDFAPEKIDGFKYCKGTSAVDSSASLQMYQYFGTDGQQHLIFPVISSSVINFPLFQPAHVAFSPQKNVMAAITTDLLVPVTHHKEDLLSLYSLLKGTDMGAAANYRYGKSGFVSKRFQETENFKKSIQLLITNSKPLEDVTWTVKNYDRTVQLILKNIVRQKAHIETKKRSREELILEVKNTIRNIFYTSDNSYKKNFSLVYKAMAVLENEIDAKISQSKTAESFPLWLSELSNLSKIISGQAAKDGAGPNKAFEFDKDSKLATVLPRLLYSLKVNSYSTYEIEIEVGPPVEEMDPQDEYRLYLDTGKISLNNEKGQIDFDLECFDWIDLFKRHTAQPDYEIEKEDTVNSSVKVVVNEASYGPGHQSSELAGKRLLAKLTSSSVKRKTDVVEGYYSFKDTEKQVQFQDLNSFFHDFQKESYLEISRCTGYPNLLQISDIRVNNCAVLSLKNAQQKYLIMFSLEEDNVVKSAESNAIDINYILRIP